MNTPEYLDLVRETLHLPSDYALQKPLGITKQAISKLRNGRDSLSDAMVLRVAEICQLNPVRVLLDMHIERAKSPEIRDAWSAMMEKISAPFKRRLSGYGPHQSLRLARR